MTHTREKGGLSIYLVHERRLSDVIIAVEPSINGQRELYLLVYTPKCWWHLCNLISKLVFELSILCQIGLFGPDNFQVCV